MADIFQRFFSNFRSRYIDMGDSTHASRVIAHPPFDLLTDGGTGENRRLEVESGSTGFWSGHEFRSFMELNISAGATQIIRFITPVNTLLTQFEVLIEGGHLHVETYLGDGTPGGSFNTSLPVIAANAMTDTPEYDPQATLATGGTYTGGTRIDFFSVKTATQSHSAASITNTLGNQRGAPAGTYYYKLISVADVILGSIRARWEERP